MRGQHVLLGTSGADGTICRLNTHTERLDWSAPLAGGCAYFSRRGERIFVGDQDWTLRELNENDGRQVQSLEVGGPVAGEVLAIDEHVLATTVAPKLDRAVLLCIASG